MPEFLRWILLCRKSIAAQGLDLDPRCRDLRVRTGRGSYRESRRDRRQGSVHAEHVIDGISNDGEAKEKIQVHMPVRSPILFGRLQESLNLC